MQIIPVIAKLFQLINVKNSVVFFLESSIKIYIYTHSHGQKYQRTFTGKWRFQKVLNKRVPLIVANVY